MNYFSKQLLTFNISVGTLTGDDGFIQCPITTNHITSIRSRDGNSIVLVSPETVFIHKKMTFKLLKLSKRFQKKMNEI